MLRGGGDLPRDPSLLKKRRIGSSAATQKPAQLELVPEPPQTPTEALVPTTETGGIVVTIKTVSLKESKGKSRVGKPSVYRSVTGKNADGKTYWFSVELDQADPKKGEKWVVTGQERNPFGKDDKPLHPIDVTSFAPYEEAVSSVENTQVSSGTADTLVRTLAGLVQKHGNYAVLQALAESMK
jgi:hypothetical protein